MANRVYPKWKEAAGIGAANVDITSGTKVTLIDTADYSYSDAHDFYDDVPAAARVASVALTGQTFTNAVFDANNAVFSAISGDISEALVIWKDTGSEATSRLIAYIDTGVAGLPVTPNGNDITVSWDVAGIFQL